MYLEDNREEEEVRQVVLERGKCHVEGEGACDSGRCVYFASDDDPFAFTPPPAKARDELRKTLPPVRVFDVAVAGTVERTQNDGLMGFKPCDAKTEAPMGRSGRPPKEGGKGSMKRWHSVNANKKVAPHGERSV
jgi:hypothetical protein